MSSCNDLGHFLNVLFQTQRKLVNAFLYGLLLSSDGSLGLLLEMAQCLLTGLFVNMSDDVLSEVEYPVQITS